MEDMTTEQVMDFLGKKYPENVQEVYGAFQELQREMKTSNVETIMLITEMSKRDNEEIQVPEQAPEAGRFGGLLGKLRN